MPRAPEDSAEAQQALTTWLSQKPDAAIVVAAMDEQPDGSIDIEVRLSALTVYHILGLMEALADQAIAIVDKLPGVEESPGYDRLLRIKEMLAADDCKL
jgi:hypothetical protein